MAGRHPQCPADAPHGLTHQGIGGRVGVMGQRMDPADGGQAPGDGGHRRRCPVVGGVGQLDHVARHAGRCRRQSVEAHRLAPQGEVGPVTGIGPDGGRRAPLSHRPGDAGLQVGQAGWARPRAGAGNGGTGQLEEHVTIFTVSCDGHPASWRTTPLDIPVFSHEKHRLS